jgi:hypothetical protein
MKTEPDDTIGNKLIANASIKSQSPFERMPLPEKDQSPVQLHHPLRPRPNSAPPFTGDITMLHGYIHLADIHVFPEIDPENAYRFVKRGSINIQMIKDAVNTLLSKTTSW